MTTHRYLIHASHSLTAIKQALAEKFLCRQQKPHSFTRVHLDTLDWRLYKKNYHLTFESPRDLHQLKLFSRDSGRLVTFSDYSESKVTAKQIPYGKLSTLMIPLLDIRELTEHVKEKVTQHVILVHNKEGKSLASIQIETARTALSGKSARVLKTLRYTPIRGYEKENRRIKKFLQQLPGLSPSLKSELDALISDFDIDVNAFNNKPNYILDAQARADDSAKFILKAFVHNMTLNTPGVSEDVDSECLHDFRIAVRRTRTLLAQVPGVFPAQRLERAKDYFAELGRVTTPQRDLDVMLLNFDDYRALLDYQMPEEMDRIYVYVEQCRAKAHEDVKKHLKLKRHVSFMQTWQTFLESSSPNNTTLANAKREVKAVASERIAKAYKKVLKQGMAITDSSPADDVHTLRKSGKKLRYLLEFFQSLYSAAQIKQVIKTLKQLQDLLGEYQDLHVHIEFFTELRSNMEADQVLDDATAKAIEKINQVLDQQQIACRKRFAARFKEFSSKTHRKEFKALLAS